MVCCSWQAAANTEHTALLQHFPQSTLSPEQQLAEWAWFADAAKPYQGMTVRVVSERIYTHWYESNVLAPLFSELTGIQVIHELTSEDDVIKKLQAQQQTGLNIYDAYINDSDLIGTHFRNQQVVSLSRFTEGEGKAVTLPTLDLDDFMGLPFTTASDGQLYQLPDQQFANLYWYRQDWFSRPELKQQFKELYGYELDVPVNWSAYQDIAEFFSEYVREIDGQRVYGHMDYGKRDPSLGWRISDAWLSMAGTGDQGLPNGIPVDEWGIRVEDCRPVGASVARGGAIDAPASIYAIQKYVDWLKDYAPPEAQNMNFSEAGAEIAKGHIAQQIFWYTAFTAELTRPELPITDEHGKPLWRVAPSPTGAYWQAGMKSGYQDVGAWTLLKSTPLKRQQAAWLYAQFAVSKSVSLTKTLETLTPIRYSDVHSEAFSAMAPKLGGLVEFYQSSAHQEWTPTGSNVPDYPQMATLWWQYAGLASYENEPVPEVMQQLAVAMDSKLEQLANSSDSPCAPRLNPQQEKGVWFAQPGSPKAKLDNENPAGRTLSYSELLKRWE
nr:ABC transporter substrate-binding protein [Aliagarivorans taiwanensis]